MKIKMPFAAATAFLLFNAAPGNAQTHIEDPWVLMKTTPILGGGFDYYSKESRPACLQFSRDPNKQVTAILDYGFESIDRTTLSKLSTDTRVDAKFKFWFVNSHVQFESKTSDETKTYYQNILVEYTIDTLYDAVNDATARLLPDAEDLILGENVDLYLRACGDHYVRSMTRKKKYFALMTYETMDNVRDQQFESKLNLAVNGFFNSANIDASSLVKLREEASSKKLSIRVQAQGVGLGSITGDLLPMSVEQFPKAVKAAIEAMNDPDTGIITSIEVSPWTANPTFLKQVQDVLKKNNNPENSIKIAENLGFFLNNSATKARANELQEQSIYIETDFLACADQLEIEKLTSNDDTQYHNRRNSAEPAPLDKITSVINFEKYEALIATTNEFQVKASKCLGALSSTDAMWSPSVPAVCLGLRAPPEVSKTRVLTEQYCPVSRL